MTNKRLNLSPLILGLIAAAVIAVVGLMEAVYVWTIGIPLVIVAGIVGILHDRRVSDSQKQHDNKGVWIGLGGTALSVGAILLRGTELAAYLTPFLAIMTGIAVWYVFSRNAQ